MDDLNVGAPSAAWYFFPGESPGRVRLSQPPVSRVAFLEKYRSVPLFLQAGANMKNEGDEAYTENVAGRREDVPSLSDSASLEKSKQLATVLTSRKPKQRRCLWLVSRRAAGVIERGMLQEKYQELGRASRFLRVEVGSYNQKKTIRWTGRQSDHLIVL